MSQRQHPDCDRDPSECDWTPWGEHDPWPEHCRCRSCGVIAYRLDPLESTETTNAS